MEGRYEALSYVWGQPVLNCPLFLSDGSCIGITSNLDRALRNLRYLKCPRSLWTDAVCIDQANNKEKAVQIPMMVRIFRGATRILAWLGEGGGEEAGLQALDHLS